MTVDWRAVRHLPTAVIIRDRLIPEDAAVGVLWGGDDSVHVLSANGVLAWEDHTDKPSDPTYEWTGANLLCNAAPTSFEVDGTRLY